jgi:ADP-heptose:LPS heptosyltransferase
LPTTLRPFKRILIVRPDAIGDMVLTIPCIVAIKRHYPDVHITLLASPYNARILDPLPPFVDEIIFDWFRTGKIKTWRDRLAYIRYIRSKQFDVAIHFYSETESIWTCALAGIPIHLGDNAKMGLLPVLWRHGVFLKTFDQTKHVVDYNFQLLKPLGITLTDADTLQLPVDTTHIQAAASLLNTHGRRSGVPLIGIQIGVGFGNRPIEPEKYGAFINALRKRIEVDVCVTPFSEKEKQFRDRLIAACEAPIIDLEGAPLTTLMGLITHYDVFVSVDTGPFHMCAAIGCPQLAIFPSRKVKPTRWAPWRNRHWIVRESRNCPHFCPHEGCPLTVCSDAIQTADMVDKTISLLNGGGVSSAKDQFDYWFKLSMTILVIGQTMADAMHYCQTLRTKGLHAVPFSGSLKTLADKLLEHDITIIHNLTGQKQIALWWIARLSSIKLFNPPMIVNHPAFADDDPIQNYQKLSAAQRF